MTRSDNYKSNRTFSRSGGGGSSILGLGSSASGIYTRTSLLSKEATESLSVTLSVKRVLINRPWADAAALRSPNWQWKDEAARNIISAGRFDQERSEFVGEMPLYPTTLVVARDVEIKAKFSETDLENIKAVWLARGTSGLWFFNLGGSASGNRELDVTRNKDGTSSFKIPDPQIIGYMCEILPACPSPDGKRQVPDLGGLKPSEF